MNPSPDAAGRTFQPLTWFDGHLDLAYIAQHGRDLTKDLAHCGGTLQPACLTFSTLRAANLHSAISTIFVRRKTSDVSGEFTFSTPDEAHAAALRQLNLHRAWHDDGWIEMAQLGSDQSKIENQKLKIHTALEGAAAIRTLEDVSLFHARGVRMASLAWAEGSNWAGGDQSGGDITPDGRQLVSRFDQLNIIHDVSHLSDRAFSTLLEIASGPIVASHSNCRALLPGSKSPERHLSDSQIRALAARPQAKIGITLFARFILPPDQLARRRATIADLLAHITHIEQLAGTRDLLALGSDFDSGFTPELLPADLQGPHDLPRLADALSAAGWTDVQIHHFANAWDDLL